ncbi:MAG: orotidine-5'-phosphate decarboxylase [Candidatus Moranbacteria bacterium]|nr:orotidine-5'-phosphate decarboxylase [Candidatus Moranbacteria bacterium]
MLKRKIVLKDRIVFALDVPYLEAKRIIPVFGPKVGWIKINSIFVGEGPVIIEEITNAGAKNFVDLKWFDNPKTLKRYVRELLELSSLFNAAIFTIHALGGKKMMEETVKTVNLLFSSERRPWVIAATILTSMRQKEYEEIGFNGKISDEVLLLAELAKKAGCDGVVASPFEASLLKKELDEDFLVVTPGIRFKGENSGYQVRSTTPREAIENGADVIVMGESLIKGGLEALEKAYTEIREGLKNR